MAEALEEKFEELRSQAKTENKQSPPSKKTTTSSEKSGKTSGGKPGKRKAASQAQDSAGKKTTQATTKAAEKSDDVAEKLCFSCNEKGHIARNCPQKAKDKDKTLFHLFMICATDGKEEGKGKIFVDLPCVVSEIFCRFMLDTGNISGQNLLCLKDAAKLGLDTRYPEVPVLSL